MSTKKQYKELKKKHPDALLLFRTGDIYIMYDDDAKVASRLLGITLIQRCTSGLIEWVASFPYKNLDDYLPRLIRSGQRVAICDAIENE